MGIFLFISISIFRRSNSFNYLYKIFNKSLFLLMFIILFQIIFFKNFFIKINLSNFISIILYESMNSVSLLFLILYLLLTLICVVKLVKFEYGPLIKRL